MRNDSFVKHRMIFEPEGQKNRPDVSICSFVTNLKMYETMAGSFEQRGFTTKNSEILYIDNSSENNADPYSGIPLFFENSLGRYIIICHQDIELMDHDFDRFMECMREIDEKDPHWALAGNAGINERGEPCLHLSDPNGAFRHDSLPKKVQTLDENFLVMRRRYPIIPSQELAGFHLYGADLCLQGRLAGCSAYVIDFYLQHKSAGGTLSEGFHESQKNFTVKYKNLPMPGQIRTTCATVTFKITYDILYYSKMIFLKLFKNKNLQKQ